MAPGTYQGDLGWRWSPGRRSSQPCPRLCHQDVGQTDGGPCSAKASFRTAWVKSPASADTVQVEIHFYKKRIATPKGLIYKLESGGQVNTRVGQFRVALRIFTDKTPSVECTPFPRIGRQGLNQI